MRIRPLCLATIASIALAGYAPAAPQALILPTQNDALFSGDNAAFFQYTDRDFEGVKSKPWEAGQFGYVRNPMIIEGRMIFTRFHGGMDIKPVNRDAAGEPTDEVRCIADGVVAYVSDAPGESNYGRYVVVGHRWDGCDYFSLYAHLAKCLVQTGQRVQQGTTLGIMGHTGDGLDRVRSHLHLELTILVNDHFDQYYGSAGETSPNKHGLYNGINLASLDITRFYKAQLKNPAITIPEFIAQEPVYYRILLPGNRRPNLLQRLPWMGATSPATEPPAWEVSFNQCGLPLRVVPSNRAVSQPTISALRKGAIPYSYLTSNIIGGNGDNPSITAKGERMLNLLTFPIK